VAMRAASAFTQVLLIVLAKPPLTKDEIKWKKGIRQDNRVKDRVGSLTQKARASSSRSG